MITKERLEELKKEKAFIFCLLNDSVSIIRLDDTYDISVDEYNKINNCQPTLYHNRNGIFQDICEMDKVFETKEDAEFALRFKRIPRTEELSLPTWKEFLKTNFDTQFITADGDLITLYRTDNSRLVVYNDNQFSKIFTHKSWELTKENFLEACEICRKLWLGE